MTHCGDWLVRSLAALWYRLDRRHRRITGSGARSSSRISQAKRTKWQKTLRARRSCAPGLRVPP